MSAPADTTRDALPAVDALPTPALVARQLAGMVVHTLREALHRWTLLAFLMAVSLFLLVLATAVSLDIVEGTLASARLFGQDIELQDTGLRITDVVATFQLVIVSLLYTFGIVLALFATCNLVPRLCAEGWVGLLLAQPVTRPTLLLGRALGGVAVVAINIAYLIGGSWLILRWKTGLGNQGYLLAGALILVAFVACYAAMVLVGVVTRSSPVSAMAGLLVMVSGHLLYALHHLPEWSLSLPAGWRRRTAVGIFESLYYALPRTQDLGSGAVAAARGEPVSVVPILASLPFVVVTLALACWWFSRRDN